MRIGILGGTFNPPHLGHLICAQAAYVELGLDQVILIPARIPPHKAVEDEPGITHRLGLCRAAVQGDEQRLEVSELEAVRPGPSYTVDTLAELRANSPDSELLLIVGADAAIELAGWREPERLLSLAALAVASRPGTSRTAVVEGLRALAGGESARFFEMPTIGVSSTMIRERVHVGQPIRYLVPDGVRQYIERHALYRGRS